MNEFGQLILKTITELFGGNSVDFLIYMSLLFVTIWLFKEFKNRVDNEGRSKSEKIETILTVLIDLRFEVNDFCLNRDNLQIIKEKLAKAAPYLSYELCQDIYKFSGEVNENEIKEFINQLTKEIDIYKSEQNDEILQLNKITLEGAISYYYKSMFKPVVLSIFLTCFSIVIGFLLLYVFLAFVQSNSILKQYYLIQNVVNMILFISLCVVCFDSAVSKKMNWGKWISFIILFISSSICFVLSSKFQFLIIINFALYLLLPIIIRKIDLLLNKIFGDKLVNK